MSSFGGAENDIREAWCLFDIACQRAARVSEIAARYETAAAGAPDSMWPFRRRMALLHRRIEVRHRASARLYALHALRLRQWLDRAHVAPRMPLIGPGSAQRPPFMAAVATAIGVEAASVTLFGREWSAGMVAASSSTARAAYDLEFVTGEGPARDATDQGLHIAAAGPDLPARWPHYGPALAELGVGAVVAVPLRESFGCLGSLCLFASEPVLADGVPAAAGVMAEALTHAVLGVPDESSSVGVSDSPLFDEVDYQASVHQAAGMVSVQCDCDIADAMALLRARAFADGQPIEDIARQVVRNVISLR